MFRKFPFVFELCHTHSQTHLNFSVHPDGKRFAVLKAETGAAATTRVNIVLNWLEELRQKAPAENK
jgi:hypothetical protein